MFDRRRWCVLLVLLLALSLSACAARRANDDTHGTTPVRRTHERLSGALWAQTAVEHDLVCSQIYLLAGIMLDRALLDRSWTAALEQTDACDSLPPAVILDVDETVLDNAPFCARLIERNVDFDRDLWDEWMAEGKAELISGAKDFITRAAMHNVAVFFVTNRDVEFEASTVANLQDVLGMNISPGQVLCKNERDGWSSDKTSRRAHLAKSHRILLLIGDDYNDFAWLGRISPQERVRATREHETLWGTKWIALPNPVYGSWERALYNYDSSLPDSQRLLIKYDALQSKRQ